MSLYWTVVPIGVVLVIVIVVFWVGLVLGWFSQQGLNRVLRWFAVRRAVRETIARCQPPGMLSGYDPDLTPAPTGLAPWYTEPGVPVRKVAATRLDEVPRLPPAQLPVPGTLYNRPLRVGRPR